MAIIVGLGFIYLAFNIGYTVFYDRRTYWKFSRRTTDFYRQFLIFNWWIDFVKGFPKVEIAFVIFFSFICLIFGGLLVYVGFQGPISVYW